MGSFFRSIWYLILGVTPFVVLYLIGKAIYCVVLVRFPDGDVALGITVIGVPVGIAMAFAAWALGRVIWEGDRSPGLKGFIDYKINQIRTDKMLKSAQDVWSKEQDGKVSIAEDKRGRVTLRA